MKHGSNPRRSRNSNGNNRAGRNRTNNPRTQVFDSNGPDVRIRGNAQQVYDKYVALARDAAAGSDHVLAESYLQHAEHYQRLINANEENKQQQQPRRTNSKTDNADGNTKQPVVDGKDVSLADEIAVAEKRNRAAEKNARTPEPA